MEFWGVEVKPGKPLHVKSVPDSYIHISQAALGDVKNAQANDQVVLKVKTGPFDMIVGTLSLGRCDQTALDLIFEKDFVLSHSSNGSVFFCGYRTDAVREDDSGISESEEEELENEVREEAKLLSKQNGKAVLKPEKASPLSSKPSAKSPAPKVEIPVVGVKAKGKPTLADKAKVVKEKKVEEEEDEDEDDDEDEEDDEEESDDDMMMTSGSDEEDLESDEEDESDEQRSQEEEPKLAIKKRPAPLLQPGSVGKKGKTETPGKAEPKTPVPAFTPKQHSGKKDFSAKKTPGKENSTTPASGKKLSQFACQPCNKNFTSESALSQHKIAKHKS